MTNAAPIWLVNDTLTCIPGTQTFWHNLLEWFPQIIDKTGGRTDFEKLAANIEKEIASDGEPSAIIRNATFFRKINSKAKTISFLQDIYTGALRAQQLTVVNQSDVVVFNSAYTRSQYTEISPNVRQVTIPIGTDFQKFKPLDAAQCQKELGIASGSILFVGSATNNPKGFDRMRALIEVSPGQNFVLVMKDDYRCSNSNVKVYNKISQELLARVYNACEMLICTSRQETLHLAGVEAGACGIPVVTTNVGIHYDASFNTGFKMQDWGATVVGDVESIKQAIMAVRHANLDTRKATEHLSLEFCKKAWTELIGSTEA
jgi:glycosyltransferase involved in cell wall biosynthesis